jgi:hypothetical protein
VSNQFLVCRLAQTAKVSGFRGAASWLFTAFDIYIRFDDGKGQAKLQVALYSALSAWTLVNSDWHSFAASGLGIPDWGVLIRQSSYSPVSRLTMMALPAVNLNDVICHDIRASPSLGYGSFCFFRKSITKIT